MRTSLWPIGVLLATPAVFASQRAAERPATATPQEVVAVSEPGAPRPAEVSVAINPTDLDHLVAVSTQRGRAGEPRTVNPSYVSSDGGLVWKTLPHPNPDRRTQGDDALAFGGDGWLYHSYIAFEGIRVARPTRAVSGIFVSRSRDGAAWEPPVPVVDHLNSVAPFEDKPWVAVDRSPESPFRGNVYVAWTRFDVYGSKDPAHKSHILFARSRDGGRSFEPPLEISDAPGDAQDSDGTVEGAVPAVGPKGEVYVAWAGPNGLVFDRSLDGGFSFGEDRKLAEMPGGWDLPLPGMTRHSGLPVTTVDVSSSKDRGSIYVSWIDERSGPGDTDVFVSASRDGGLSWSPPLRVNEDAPGRPQLFQASVVDPADGSLNVVFYDRRGLPGTLTGLTLARSVDGGRSFVNHRVAQPPFETNDKVFFGDYIGLDARAGRIVAVYPVFADPETLTLRAVLFRFKPGTQEAHEVRVAKRP